MVAFETMEQAPSSDTLVHTEPATKAYFGDQDLGEGTLYVGENNLSWRSSGGTNRSFHLNYPQISLHATCRDTNSFPHPCIYCLLDDSETPVVQTNENEDDNPDTQEVRFVPQNTNTLETIYNAICECQELHPDDEDDEDDENDGYAGDLGMMGDEQLPMGMMQGLGGGSVQGLGSQFYTADNLPDSLAGFYTSDNMADGNMPELSEEGQATLQRLTANMQLHSGGGVAEVEEGMNGVSENGQFEDA